MRQKADAFQGSLHVCSGTQYVFLNAAWHYATVPVEFGVLCWRTRDSSD